MDILGKTVSSIEISAIVGREHNNVMKDIRRTITQIGPEKNYQAYFVEGSYYNQQNKEMPCYWLTKKGCELFATRMNGEKGVQFAMFYIDRFNEMEENLRNYQQMDLLDSVEEVPPAPAPKNLKEPTAMEKLRLMFEVTENTVSRLDHTENRLVELEENVGIDPGDYRYIGDRVTQRVSEIARSFGDITNEQRRMLYKDINGSIKKITGVPTRSHLKKRHFEKVCQFILEWEPSAAVRTLIREMGSDQ